MGTTDWNWLLETDLQDYPWDCAACSTAWGMRTVGFEVTEQDVISGLGPARISPTYGLLDASGAGLVSYLEEMGIGAHNNSDVDWLELQTFAGTQPAVIGGRAWCHWVAVRMSSTTAGRPDLDTLILMNPAPGYQGVAQLLDRASFDRLGPFSAVWFDAW